MFSSKKACRSETRAELLEETVVGWLLAVVVRGCDGIEVTPSPASSENGLNTMSIVICSLVRGGNNLDDGVSKANTSRSSQLSIHRDWELVTPGSRGLEATRSVTPCVIHTDSGTPYPK